MSMKRIILEMGFGTNLHGMDYTKAARRAVQDALHRSSVTVMSSLGMDHTEMEVRVTIGVQDPDQVDCDLVAADLPRGKTLSVRAVKGGLDVGGLPSGDRHIVATAAIEAFLPDQQGAFRLSS
ncbi:Lin0512 family protein [Ruegeria sp. 2012CJ41-6]|uniref:Lin0512 family protein n=1 Tax=Ruegeria spongiae TaxID=2942209 RepID=A0ABT0Q0W0_9RHOB|nr:Lin0512 family protein [Ruegeria spongiae]MCL6283511.1 Lin0512 family protein [Ruegeria spongiae]